MYYTIYKTTNKVNNKWYIGAHATSNPHDAYLGSGSAIKVAIEKHGRDNFYKEILHIVDTKEEMYQKERELVTEDIVYNRMSYNLSIGGKGGWNINNITSTHINTKSGWILKEDYDPNIHEGHSKGMVVVRDEMDNMFTVHKDDPIYVSGELVPYNQGMTQLESVNKKRSETMKKIVWPKTHCNICNRDIANHRWGTHINGAGHLKNLSK